jgi:hypothetical protein
MNRERGTSPIKRKRAGGSSSRNSTILLLQIQDSMKAFDRVVLAGSGLAERCIVWCPLQHGAISRLNAQGMLRITFARWDSYGKSCSYPFPGAIMSIPPKSVTAETQQSERQEGDLHTRNVSDPFPDMCSIERNSAMERNSAQTSKRAPSIRKSIKIST